MKEYNVPMALVDYIPVVLFFLATNKAYKALGNRMSKISKILFLSGVYLVTIAGALKATYKLLYALNIGDFVWLNNQFFSNQAIGFLLAGIGISIAVINKKDSTVYAFLPTMALVGIMIIGLGAMDASLCYVASKMKKRSALVLFVISFFLSLGMGYLSSRNFDTAAMNWAAQGINTVGQLCLYIGVNILDNAGLKNY